MLIYLINFLTVPIYSTIIKNKKAFIAITSLQMFLILAFRAETLGVDVDLYKIYYNSYSQHSFLEIIKSFRFFFSSEIEHGLESGYVLFNWLCAQLGFDFKGFLIIHSAICVLSLALFVNKYSKTPWITFVFVIALGIYEYMFCILRQTLALAILLFSIKYIKERKALKFFLLVILATLCHKSTIVFSVIYFLPLIKVSKRNIIAWLIACVAFIAVFPLIAKVVLEPLLALLGKEIYSIGSFTMNNMILLMFAIAIYIMLFSDYDKLFKKGEDNSILLWGFLVALPIQCISLYSPVFSRLAIGVFMCFATALIPNVSRESGDKWLCFFTNVAFFALCAVFYLYTLPSSYIIPYISAF